MPNDINHDTGLPHLLSVGDTLRDIELSPAFVSELLRNWAYGHLGGPHDELGRKLIEHANKVSDPATYGNAPAPEQANPQVRWGQQSTAQQGQSALPATGTTNEPSWQADARAAGWNAPDAAPTSTPAPSFGSPRPAMPGSDRPRHYDDTLHQWVYNDTGEVVEGEWNRPNFANPPSTSPAVASPPPQPSAPPA